MAVHYYDEDNVEVGKPVSCGVVVNHHVEISEEEKAQAKANALKRLQDEAYAKMTAKKTVPKKEVTEVQPSLF